MSESKETYFTKMKNNYVDLTPIRQYKLINFGREQIKEVQDLLEDVLVSDEE